jgi:ubiquinone/menaquinone biosynthesis C-methylase UbiE
MEIQPVESSECCGGKCACKDEAAAVSTDSPAAIRAVVRERYAKAAREAAAGARGCCGETPAARDPVTSGLYAGGETAGLPEAAVRASLGCGNPTLLAELREGETVLDLGSGGGIDVLLSARRVGPAGFAFGLDMTDEMLSLARRNQQEAGVANVEFLKGEIEAIPLPNDRVDVIISNCVINLSADKGRVLGEAFRVLKPGGRFAVSDIVVRKLLPATVRRSLELWAGCVAGALEEWTYRGLLEGAGFEDVEIVPTRIYTNADARSLLSGSGVGEADLEAVEGAFMSAFVRARKPAAARA